MSEATVGTDLLARLRAAIDETERVARAATAGPWRYSSAKMHIDPETGRCEEGVFSGPPGWDAVCIATTGEVNLQQNEADAEHIARHDPASVLRRCAIDRRVLERHDYGWAGTLGCKGCGEPWPCPDLRDLAAALDVEDVGE